MLPPDATFKAVEPLLANDYGLVWRTLQVDPNWRSPGTRRIYRYYLQKANADAVQLMEHAPTIDDYNPIWIYNDGTMVFEHHGCHPWALVSIHPSGATTTQSLEGIRLNETDENPYPIGACSAGVFLQPHALCTKQPIYFVPWGPTKGTVILTSPKYVTDSPLDVLSVHLMTCGDTSAFFQSEWPIKKIQWFNSRSGANGTLAINRLWPLGFVDNRVFVGYSDDLNQIISIDMISKATATFDISNLRYLYWGTSIQQGDRLWIRVADTDDFIRPFLKDLIDREHTDWSRAVRRETPKDVPEGIGVR